MTNFSFADNVYAVVKLIPYGRVTTYGAIAKYLGAPRSSRMVGWALNNCHHISPPLPAHRVVNRNGLLTGKAHFETYNTMCERLISEGIRIENDAVIDMPKLLWDPAKELPLNNIK